MGPREKYMICQRCDRAFINHQEKDCCPFCKQKDKVIPFDQWKKPKS